MGSPRRLNSHHAVICCDPVDSRKRNHTRHSGKYGPPTARCLSPSQCSWCLSRLFRYLSAAQRLSQASLASNLAGFLNGQILSSNLGKPVYKWRWIALDLFFDRLVPEVPEPYLSELQERARPGCFFVACFLPSRR